MSDYFTLLQISEELQKRGIKAAPSTLSEIIASGDVASQLGKRKDGNRTLYPSAAVDVLAEVISIIRADSRLTWTSASDIMRRVLTRESTALSVIGEKAEDRQLQVLSEIRELLKDSLTPPADALLTLKAAHIETGIPYAILRTLRVQVGRRYYCRRSDCLRYIASLKTSNL